MSFSLSHTHSVTWIFFRKISFSINNRKRKEILILKKRFLNFMKIVQNKPLLSEKKSFDTRKLGLWFKAVDVYEVLR